MKQKREYDEKIMKNMHTAAFVFSDNFQDFKRQRENNFLLFLRIHVYTKSRKV
jgi:hypothetical protein